jgi:ABC-type lipoprotein export system ATPase subunit
LINQPELILADEPTGSLDQDSAFQLGELLLDINRKHNVAMVVVTHSLTLAEKMSTMYRLSKGKLV